MVSCLYQCWSLQLLVSSYLLFCTLLAVWMHLYLWSLNPMQAWNLALYTFTGVPLLTSVKCWMVSHDCQGKKLLFTTNLIKENCASSGSKIPSICKCSLVFVELAAHVTNMFCCVLCCVVKHYTKNSLGNSICNREKNALFSWVQLLNSLIIQAICRYQFFFKKKGMSNVVIYDVCLGLH